MWGVRGGERGARGKTGGVVWEGGAGGQRSCCRVILPGAALALSSSSSAASSSCPGSHSLGNPLLGLRGGEVGGGAACPLPFPSGPALRLRLLLPRSIGLLRGVLGARGLAGVSRHREGPLPLLRPPLLLLTPGSLSVPVSLSFCGHPPTPCRLCDSLVQCCR